MKTTIFIFGLLLAASVGLFSQPTKTCNLTLFLEGLFIGSNTMRPAMNASGYQWGPTIADMLTVELYDAPDYSGVVYTTGDIPLSINGVASFTLPDTYNAVYYITIRTRNHTLTVSKFPVSFTDEVINFNFDTFRQVYGHNMLQTTDGIYVIIAGDVNQDGLIDGTDMLLISNQNDMFSTGFLNEDVNGDGLVDGSDLSITSNNNDRFIWAMTPNIAIDGQPCPGAPVINDTRDGHVYTTVLISSQCWMAQNLNIGTYIPGSSNQTNNGITEKYCWGDIEAYCFDYGGLYQWDEVMQYSSTQGGQGLCMTGWHIPSDDEWTELTDYLGGALIAGGKLKESGNAHWVPPNIGATNSSGFTALPGGNRNSTGSFYSLFTFGYFWTSTKSNVTYSHLRYVLSSGEVVTRAGGSILNAYSARCLKD